MTGKIIPEPPPTDARDASKLDRNTRIPDPIFTGQHDGVRFYSAHPGIRYHAATKVTRSATMKSYTVSEKPFPELLREVRNGALVQLTEQGEPTAVLLSSAEFDVLRAIAQRARRHDPSAALWAWRDRTGGVKLSEAEWANFQVPGQIRIRNWADDPDL